MQSHSRSLTLAVALLAALAMPLFALMALRASGTQVSSLIFTHWLQLDAKECQFFEDLGARDARSRPQKNRAFRAAMTLSEQLLSPVITAAHAESACGADDPFCLKKAATGGGLTPGGEAPSIPTAVGRILSAMLALLGVLFFALTVWAGFKWMTAQGNQETATSAKTTLENAVIGLVLVVVAYALTTYVVNALFWTPSVSINGITPVQPSVTGPLDECSRVYGGTCKDRCEPDERSFVTDDCSLVCCVLNLQCPTYGYVCQTLDVNGRCPTGGTPTQNDFKCYDVNQACCP